MQCDLFMSDESGKWINIEGKVGSVQTPGSVLLLVGATNRGVGCFFDDKWRAQLGTFRRTDVIKVVGKIAHFQGGTLILRECELRD
jgi:hypothetical protein